MTDAAQWLDAGCHCDSVRLRVRVRAREALACNCSICRKKGFVHIIVGAEDLDLRTPWEALETYTFNTHVAQHWFCRRCGITAFYRPRSHPDGYSVNLRCLDDAGARHSFVVRDFDGANWEANVGSIRD